MNFNLEEILNLLTTQNIFYFFFKAFAVLFSLTYIIYSLVVYRQTQVMSKTVQTKNNNIVISFSFFQIIIAIIVFLFAIFLV